MTTFKFAIENVCIRSKKGLFFFADVVHQKNPLTARLAYRKARDAANQAGREQKSFLMRENNDDSPTDEKTIYN